jgi:hypothetical protein
MSKRLLTTQPASFLLRSFSSASHEQQPQVKPFSEIPTPSIWRMIVGNLPGGRYYKKSVMEMNSLLHEDYGKIIKIPSILGNKGMVLVYTSEEFEKVRGLWICEYSDDD